ncbi:adenosylcobalamin-dependent ribonucleoside-diphosphate reductase [archaeon]|jgi:ribonucleoside-diphosphate reductase alpha chain|nr:adenosylcobalamin-dependent ribonucleoside-diphosphate reductase [archaeon]
MVKNLESRTDGPEIRNERIYPHAEALESSLKYFNGDEVAATQFLRKYALKDSDGNLYESNPDQMHHRMAKEIARIELEKNRENPLQEEEIYSFFKDFRYLIPGGGNMSGIGNKKQVTSLSNCFVIGHEGPSDSYGGIMKIDQEQVQLMKRRGGVGHDLSHIRPSYSPVLNSALTSTGVVPFMERYSNSTKEVAQDGRRGALMLSISIKHPDAEYFIDAKTKKGKVTNANISVKIDDDFMNAVKNNETYVQQFPINSDNPKVTKEIDARALWDKIITNAWQEGEPGVLFWDAVIRESIPDCYSDFGYATVSTNPCGEIPLCPYDSCRLLALNLYSYVENAFTTTPNFNYSKFKEHVHMAQRISDNIIDLEIEKIDEISDKIKSDPEDAEIKRVELKLWENIRKKAIEGRRMGLGITAEGDMIAGMNLTYGTNEATEFATEIHKTFALEAYKSSVNMAKERGAFIMYDSKREENNPFIQRIREEDPKLYNEMLEHGRRNLALLTIAPTGTVSLMARTTSGIEPVYLPVHDRNIKIDSLDETTEVSFIDDEGVKWHTYNVFHPKFEEWMKVKGHDPEGMSKEELNELAKVSPYNMATIADVNWIKKVEMQGQIQQWIDHSISATTNMPKGTPKEVVAEAYMKAWKSGCKGMTVYVDGSRGDGVLSSGNNLEKIVLVQKNVKVDPRLNIKPQAIKYKVRRDQNKDSLHIILTSDLYLDEKTKKAYFIPDEDFQIRAPNGAATSVSFSQSGMDRTEILRGPNPDHAEFVKRLQSPHSNQSEGMGPMQIKSIEHAAGLVFEDYLFRNGIIGRDENTNELINLVRKKDLRKIKPGTEEYNAIISQVKIGDDEEEITINGNNGKPDIKFVCENCSGEKIRFNEGCNSPVCAGCGHDNGVGCS